MDTVDDVVNALKLDRMLHADDHHRNLLHIGQVQSFCRITLSHGCYSKGLLIVNMEQCLAYKLSNLLGFRCSECWTLYHIASEFSVCHNK